MCGVCDENPQNDCVQDCTGTWGGSSTLDECGVCGGNNSSCSDCAGNPNGVAYQDQCGNCDDIPNNDCIQDCNENWGGTAIIDSCGDCTGGFTGLAINYNDSDNDGICNEGANNGDIDNCPETFNPEQENFDSDESGNACDIDDDNDGVDDMDDENPLHSFECNDTDVDSCDDCSNGFFNPFNDGPDLDSDGVCNISDICQGGDDRFDDDLDGIPNDCDVDLYLHEGANLISFFALPVDNSVSVILSDLGESVSGIIGAGVVSSYFGFENWIGNLEEIDNKSGYWLKLNDDGYLQTIGVPSNDLTYYLLEGNNLCSYSYSISQPIVEALPSHIHSSIHGIAGEGYATMNINGTWHGSLSYFEGGKGYWFQSFNEIEFSYNPPIRDDLVLMSNMNNEINRIPEVPSEYEFTQSGNQAFFFVSEASINGHPVERGDWLVAFHNHVVVGSRMWNGEFTDVPAMGFESDNSDTAGYSELGSQIDFKVFDISESQLVEMNLVDGENIWENNALKSISIEGFTR